MRRKFVIWVSIVVCCLVIVCFFLFIHFVLHNNVSSQNIPQRHIALGAWTEGLFDPATKTLHPEKLTAFERLIQKKVSIAHYYIGWESLASPQLITQFNTLRSFGWTPMLNVNPYYFSQCPAADIPLYQAIAQGKCDDFLKRAANNIKKIKQPFYLVFAWEMNNPQNQWSIAYTGSTSSDFISAWRHIHTIFKYEGAANVKWVFCPNVPDDVNAPYTSLYPGDGYVDWVGLDGYNWGTTQPWSKWISFSGVFGNAYKKLTTIAPNKPLMIAEVNAADKGGDKSAWYVDMFTKEIPYNFPKIVAVVIFNEDRSKQEQVNWDVNQTPDSLRGFILGVHAQFYKN